MPSLYYFTNMKGLQSCLSNNILNDQLGNIILIKQSGIFDGNHPKFV